MEQSILLKFNKIRMGVFLILIFCIFPGQMAIAQQREPNLTGTIGITWRSTPIDFFNSKYIDIHSRIPSYNDERNVQGFSLNIGLIYRISSILSLEYHPNIRYDQITFHQDTVGWMRSITRTQTGVTVTYQPIHEQIPNKEFILDHNFNLVFTTKLNWGLGLSIINTGKSFQYENPIGSPSKTENIQFVTYNAFVVIPVKKILFLELKALYTNNLPASDPNDNHIMFSTRLFYKIRFKSNLKAHNK